MNGFNPQNFMQQFQQFRQNPMQFLMQHRLNIPQEYANDPQGAIQHLMNTGKMNQQQYNQLQQMAMNMQRMFGQK